MNCNEQRDSSYVSPDELRNTTRAVRPKDAATLIIVRGGGKEPRVLMGKRAASHKFMPNKFVFPGGKVDPADSRIVPPHDLHPASDEAAAPRLLRSACACTRIGGNSRDL